MWKLKAGALAASLTMIVACGRSDEARESMNIKHTYSLCPKTSASKQRLYEQLRDFADQQQAELIDRGAEAQRELSGIEAGSNVLKNTGGMLMLITVEKPGEFRITVSNLELKEKFGLAVRIWAKSSDHSPLAVFMSDLDSSWVIQKVDGSVTNDPPC